MCVDQTDCGGDAGGPGSDARRWLACVLRLSEGMSGWVGGWMCR